MKISSLAGTLNGVTDMMNRSTDLKSWKNVNRRRRETTKVARQQVLEEGGGHHAFPTDLIPFRFRNVGFSFSEKEFLHDINLTVPQGSVVSILGHHGQGRGTFLRLIGQELFPQRGE